MDVRAANGSSAAYRYPARHAEIDIDRIVVALAGLNDKISRLREEIDALKREQGNEPTRVRSR